jgi:hypothetical protein
MLLSVLPLASRGQPLLLLLLLPPLLLLLAVV